MLTILIHISINCLLWIIPALTSSFTLCPTFNVLVYVTDENSSLETAHNYSVTYQIVFLSGLVMYEVIPEKSAEYMF